MSTQTFIMGLIIGLLIIVVMVLSVFLYYANKDVQMYKNTQAGLVNLHNKSISQVDSYAQTQNDMADLYNNSVKSYDNMVEMYNIANEMLKESNNRIEELDDMVFDLSEKFNSREIK
jgi:uncharacterized protein YlxW (UPF0749 family)